MGLAMLVLDDVGIRPTGSRPSGYEPNFEPWAYFKSIVIHIVTGPFILFEGRKWPGMGVNTIHVCARHWTI